MNEHPSQIILKCKNDLEHANKQLNIAKSALEEIKTLQASYYTAQDCGTAHVTSFYLGQVFGIAWRGLHECQA